VTRRTRLAVVLAGLTVSVLIGATRSVPADELAQLVGIGFSIAFVIGMLTNLGLRWGRVTTLRTQVVLVAMASVVATALGTIVAADAMFVSAHDLTALLVVLTAASTVGLLCTLQLGARVGRASRSLGDLTRLIGDRPVRILAAGTEGPYETAELEILARELEAMSRRLVASQDREELLDRSRRELIAWVSHDLRTPLAGIRAMAEALHDGVVNDEATVARYHRTIQSETERLSNLVDDLFELSRIQADAVNLHLEPGSLGDIASDAIAAAQPRASAQGVELEGHLLAPPPVDLATPELGRVLGNLLDNAVRHTPAGGTVTVEVGGDHDHAYVSVHDECGGIPDAELGRVFELAYRGDSARTPDHRGSGLGLAIARGLVAAHDGRLDVRNVGPGCEFTVRLPRRARPQPDPVTASPRP
jgi:signal transduction histidine kinase